MICGVIASHKGDTNDTEIMDIYLENILWYMRSEVENRLNNTQVMEINRSK
jgi:hypothetical protein